MKRLELSFYFISIFLATLFGHLFSSDKNIQVGTSLSEIKIDGKINRNEWAVSDSGTNFIQMEPEKGKQASDYLVM